MVFHNFYKISIFTILASWVPILPNFLTLLGLNLTPSASFCLSWDPLGAIWGSLWASLGLLWRPLASLLACQGASWSQFKQFEAPKPHSATISNGISMIFHEFW